MKSINVVSAILQYFVIDCWYTRFFLIPIDGVPSHKHMLSFFKKYIRTIKNWWKFYNSDFSINNSHYYTCYYCNFSTYCIFVRKYKESPLTKERRVYFETLRYFSPEDEKKFQIKLEESNYLNRLIRSYVCLNCGVVSHEPSATYDDTAISIDEFFRQNIK